jgi:hypothetical protein
MNKTQTSLERQTGTYFISCIPDACKRKWQIALKTEVAERRHQKNTYPAPNLATSPAQLSKMENQVHIAEEN